jgi:hypothetical protein
MSSRVLRGSAEKQWTDKTNLRTYNLLLSPRVFEALKALEAVEALEALEAVEALDCSGLFWTVLEGSQSSKSVQCVWDAQSDSVSSYVAWRAARVEGRLTRTAASLLYEQTETTLQA